MLRTCLHLSVLSLLSFAGLPVCQAQSEGDARLELSLRPHSAVDNETIAGQAPADLSPRAVDFGSDVPSLRVNTQGPDTLVVGRAAEYLITLANQSEFAADHVVVHVQIPSWVELQQQQATVGSVERQASESDSGELVWKVDKIAGHAEQVLALMLIPRAGRAFELGVDVSVRPTMSATKITVEEPKLAVQLTGTADVVSGDVAEWTVKLENPGTGTAHDIRLDLYSGADKLGSQAVGSLEAGAQRIVDVRMPTRTAGHHELRAVAVAEPGLSAQATSPYQVRRGELKLQVHGPAVEYAGAEATYEIHVSNAGNAEAAGVRMEFILPRGAKYRGRMSDQGADSAAAPAGLHWTVAELQPGAEQSFRIACELLQSGDHQATVRASNAAGLSAAAAVETRVQAVADLQLQVIDPTGPRGVGDPVEIEIRLTNRGSAAARQVFVAALCGEQVELVDVTGNATIEAGEIFFQPIGELPAGETVSQRVTVRATEAGGHPFRATVECSDPESRLVCEEYTQFFVRDSMPWSDDAAPARTASPLPIRKIQIR